MARKTKGGGRGGLRHWESKGLGGGARVIERKYGEEEGGIRGSKRVKGRRN